MIELETNFDAVAPAREADAVAWVSTAQGPVSGARITPSSVFSSRIHLSQCF